MSDDSLFLLISFCGVTFCGFLLGVIWTIHMYRVVQQRNLELEIEMEKICQ